MSKIKKIFFIVIPLIPIIIGIVFAIVVNVPRLDYTYSKAYDGYLVSLVYGNGKEYTIPSTYNDKKVVGIDTRAFYNHYNLETINFESEENIKVIERLAFSECKSLKNIDLSNVREIGKNAFYNCVSLDNINVGAKYIGSSAFFGCSSLKNITILDDCVSIGSYAFTSCYSLEALTIPKNVMNVGSKCFDYSGIKELRVPSYLRENSYIVSLDYVVFY